MIWGHKMGMRWMRDREVVGSGSLRFVGRVALGRAWSSDMKPVCEVRAWSSCTKPQTSELEGRTCDCRASHVIALHDYLLAELVNISGNVKAMY